MKERFKTRGGIGQKGTKGMDERMKNGKESSRSGGGRNRGKEKNYGGEDNF